MKKLHEGYRAHVKSGATTLSTCWRVLRNDGVSLGFTDHDEVIIFDGTSFEPTAGSDGSELTAKAGFAVDTSEMLGVLSSAAIAEDDVRLGRYNQAVVEIWKVNWRDSEQRDLLRRDSIGDITREDGYFKAELRSAEIGLNVERGRLYQGLCGTNLGDAPCGIDLRTPQNWVVSEILAFSGNNRFVLSGLEGFEADWFIYGKAVWTSGQRIGVTDRVITQYRLSGVNQVTFEEDVSAWVTVGDTLELFAGCDRRFSTCKSKYQNQINFRGFPHIPGNDFILKYPKEGDTLNGVALVK